MCFYHLEQPLAIYLSISTGNESVASLRLQLVSECGNHEHVIYGIIAKTKVVIGASQPEARSAEGCDASRSPPLVEAMTPFHTTNARV